MVTRDAPGSAGYLKIEHIQSLESICKININIINPQFLFQKNNFIQKIFEKNIHNEYAQYLMTLFYFFLQDIKISF